MGTYLAKEIVGQIIIPKKQTFPDVPVDKITKCLKDEINLNYYDFTEDLDGYYWRIKPDIEDKIKIALDMWSAFLTRNDLLHPDNLPKAINRQNLSKAISVHNVLNDMNLSEKERAAYEDQLKWLRVEANTLKKYEQKGREEGIKMTVINMLKQKLSDSLIMQVTGLSEEELERIKNII